MKKVEVESCGQCKKEFTCKATGASIRRGRGLWVPGPNCPLEDDRTEALEAEVARLKAQLAEQVAETERWNDLAAAYRGQVESARNEGRREGFVLGAIWRGERFLAMEAAKLEADSRWPKRLQSPTESDGILK